METIENSMIYQFIEKKYDEVELRDGGYFSDVHDIEVFELASYHFNMTIEEVNKIYESFSSKTAKIEELKLKLLPKNKRHQIIERRISDIMKNNKSLPFHKTEGEPVEKLEKGLDIFKDEYFKIVEELGEKGWVLPMLLKFSDLDKLKNISESEKLSEFFNVFFADKKLKLIRKHIKNSSLKENHKELFEESLIGLFKGKYNVSVNLLLPILEGCLSEYYDDKGNTRMMKVCKLKVDKLYSEGKLMEYLIWSSQYKFIENLYKKSDFNSEEPEIVNRHWILHGRTESNFEREDCIKLINSIHSLVSLKKAL